MYGHGWIAAEYGLNSDGIGGMESDTATEETGGSVPGMSGGKYTGIDSSVLSASKTYIRNM